ncbi:hypothetical protein D3C76_1731290 [compost metagenome]
MRKLGIHLVGQVAYPTSDGGAPIDLVAEKRAVKRVRRHGHRVGAVGKHRGDVPRIDTSLPLRRKVIGQPQIADPVRHVGRCVALA